MSLLTKERGERLRSLIRTAGAYTSILFGLLAIFLMLRAGSGPTTRFIGDVGLGIAHADVPHGGDGSSDNSNNSDGNPNRGDGGGDNNGDSCGDTPPNDSSDACSPDPNGGDN